MALEVSSALLLGKTIPQVVSWSSSSADLHARVSVGLGDSVRFPGGTESEAPGLLRGTEPDEQVGDLLVLLV